MPCRRADAPRTPAEPVAHGRAHWLREAADDLATDTVVREQVGKAPVDEVSRLREAGLLTLLTPAGPGGAGVDWDTAYAVVREISTADGAIGQLLGSHYFLSWSARFFGAPETALRTAERSAAEQWCWGGGFAPQDPPLTLSRSSRGLVLGGRQSYPTGVLVADRLAVRAVREDTGEPLAVVVDPRRRGVVVDAAGDTFGLRLAGGGSVEFDDVAVGADDVLGSLSADEDHLVPRAALAAPVGGCSPCSCCSAWPRGAGRGARVQQGRAPHLVARPVRRRARRPADAHRVRRADGARPVRIRAVRPGPGRRATGLERGEDLTYDEYADISALVSMAETAASRAAQESATRALDIVGPRSASARLGFDRFWRNARTHTLYEPVAHRLRDVGDYFLNGAHPCSVLPA